MERESHDIEVVSLYPLHQTSPNSLDTIAPSLVHRFAGLNVAPQNILRNTGEIDLCLFIK